jgi:hypothetical protein
MSEEEEEAASSWTAIVFAILSLIFYWLFLKPTTAPTDLTNNNENNTNGNNAPTRRTPRQAPRRQAPPDPQQRRIPALKLSEAAQELLISCQSKPPFVKTDKDRVGLGGMRVLVDGLVAFSHTNSSLIEGLDVDSLRGERAKILSRLAIAPGMSISSPPGKGSTIVVAIPVVHLKVETISRVLYVLGTYYNLLVICAHDINVTSLKEQLEQRKKVEEEIYSREELTIDILPKHRVLIASTITGRVALVRQLSRVELVIDFDESVQTELTRFGYKVAVIPQLHKLLEE